MTITSGVSSSEEMTTTVSVMTVGLGGGGSLAAASVETAEDVYDESTRVSQKLVRDTMDLSEKYRFVRFLPDFIYAGSGGPEAGPVLNKRILRPFLQVRPPGLHPEVGFYHL